jgi:hypothetical protein
MRFLPKGLDPFKIQIRFKLEFASEFYNSKSIVILKLGQNRKTVPFEFIYQLVKFGNF